MTSIGINVGPTIHVTGIFYEIRPSSYSSVTVYGAWDNIVLKSDEVVKYEEQWPLSGTLNQLSNGLIAEYHFDSDAKDSSGNGNDGTINGGAAFVDGVEGKAMSFDGVDDYVETSSVINLGDKSFTLETWYKNPGVNQDWDGHIIANYNGMPFAVLQLGGKNSVIDGKSWTGKATFWIRDAAGHSSYVFSSNRIDDNRWHHIAGVRDTSTGKIYLYIDGVLDAQADGSSTGDVDSGDKFTIGGGDPGSYTNAFMDEVRIYNRALSAEEVKAEHDKYAPPTITSISVSPSPATVTVGSPQLFTATDQDGNPISVDWSSSNTIVGIVSPSTGTSTTFTGQYAGTTIITATKNGITGTADVTVKSPLTVTGLSLSDLPAENKPVTVTATVRNDGDSSAMNVLANFWNGELGTIDVIPAHSSATVSVPWSEPTKDSEPAKPNYYTNTIWASVDTNRYDKNDVIVGDTGGFMYSQTFIKGSEIPNGLIVQYPQFANLYLFDSKEAYFATHFIVSADEIYNSPQAEKIKDTIDFACVYNQLYLLYSTGGASLPLCASIEVSYVVDQIIGSTINYLASDWDKQFDFSQDVEESPDGNIWIMQIVSLDTRIVDGQTTSDKYNLDYYYKDHDGNWIRYYSTQKDISVMMPVVSSTNKETVYFETDKGVIADISSIDPILRPQPPKVLNLHYGLFSFNVVGIEPGSSITLTLVFPDDLPPGTSYWKYDENHNPKWYRIPSTVDENKIIITLTDGGELDEDGEVNGKIKDDGGPSIGYIFTGFFQPIDNLPSWNSVKAGSAVPVKFSLDGYQGLDIFTMGYPASQQINCDSKAPIDAVNETVTAGSSSLSYNATIDQYNYVWKTDKAWIGSCRKLQVQLKDGTFHNASFKLLK
ncbi:MAG: PxKF domain-containing protein [Candidatus Methanoperedens sp.]|nr:PxKF domain-containing protein [Candidatus Methanoperedens sp.]